MSGKLVTLATYDNVPLSELARLRLEEAGIRVRLENADIVNTLWHYGSALGGVRLIVDEEDAAAAAALIENLQESPLLGPETNSGQAPSKCLACGADFPLESDRCDACGWSFASDAGMADADREDSDDDPDVRAEVARMNELPLKPRFAQVRDVGRPVVSVWVAMMIAGVVLAFLTCVLTVLDDLFR